MWAAIAIAGGSTPAAAQEGFPAPAISPETLPTQNLPSDPAPNTELTAPPGGGEFDLPGVPSPPGQTFPFGPPGGIDPTSPIGPMGPIGPLSPGGQAGQGGQPGQTGQPGQPGQTVQTGGADASALAGSQPPGAVAGLLGPPAGSPGGAGSAEFELALADVLASVYRSYPEIERARLQGGVAAGEQLEALGVYDTKLEGYSIEEPLGYYKNYRHGIGVARQTWWNGYLSAGYRVGRGFFEPWYRERETEKGGEFKLAYAAPLLQGRAIDPQRVAVFQADLRSQAVPSAVQQTLLEFGRDAAASYWAWVAGGATLVAQRQLLEQAVRRGEQLQAGFAAGRFAEIDVILNNQLIAERAAYVLTLDQKNFALAQKLALYLRDENGMPLLPPAAWLPTGFPAVMPQPIYNLPADVSAAIARRPEPVLLQLELQGYQWDQRLASNQLLPQLDVLTEASQDFGGPGTPSNDKGETELVLGVQGEVPLQRRKARGKLQSTGAKIAQTSQKLQLQRDKIAVEVLTAANNLRLSYEIVAQARLALSASTEALARYRFAYEQGRIDLIYLNLFESKVAETQIKLVEAQRDYFTALATLQTALGLDPLEAAMRVSELR